MSDPKSADVESVDLDSFPLVPKGNRFEDFETGRCFEHHWGRTFTEADNVLFTTATCTWLPLYLNAEYSRSLGHPDVLVHPMLLLCTIVGLSVEDLSEGGGPFLGVDDCEFEADVYPGDTLTCSSVVLNAAESSSRPHMGIVKWRTEAVNQRGETVLTLTRTNLVNRRTPS